MSEKKTLEKNLVKALVKLFGEDFPEETCNYLINNAEEYISEDSEVYENIRYIARDLLYKAEDDLEYDKLAEKNTVSLDRKTKTMYFNEIALPAYWYHPGMKTSEVNAKLKEYHNLWRTLDFDDVKYPEMEAWHSLDDWLHDYTEEEIKAMEKTLERNDTDEAILLNDLKDMGMSVYALKDHYPVKIDTVESVDNYRIVDKELCGDATLSLFNGETCKVSMHYSINGHSEGMSALGKKGFPYMTDIDRKILEEAFFSNILGEKEYNLHKKNRMELVSRAVKKLQ